MQRLIYCLAQAWFDQVRSWSHHSHRLTSVNQSETSKLDNWPIRVQVMTGHDPLIFITLDVTTSHMYSYTTYNFYCSTNKQSVKKITWKKYGSGILTWLDSITRHCQRVENVMTKAYPVTISATKKGTRGVLGPPRRSKICNQKVPNLTSEGPKLYLRSNNGFKKED